MSKLLHSVMVRFKGKLMDYKNNYSSKKIGFFANYLITGSSEDLPVLSKESWFTHKRQPCD